MKEIFLGWVFNSNLNELSSYSSKSVLMYEHSNLNKSSAEQY